MRFAEAYEDWTDRRLTQEEAASLPGVCSHTFRRYVCRYEEESHEGLLDRRMNEVSHRRVPVDEMMQVVEQYHRDHEGRNMRMNPCRSITDHGNWHVTTTRDNRW